MKRGGKFETQDTVSEQKPAKRSRRRAAEVDLSTEPQPVASSFRNGAVSVKGSNLKPSS